MIRLLLLVLSLLLQSPAFAEEKQKQPTISPWLYKKLQKSEQLIAKKSYAQAEQKLKAMLQDTKEKSYEKAIVLRSLSSVYALSNQYKKAANTLNEALSLKVLPTEQEQQAILNLGQLYMAIDQYSKAIQVLEPWLAKKPNPDVQIHVLVANAYAQLKRYRKALPHIKKSHSENKKTCRSLVSIKLSPILRVRKLHLGR